jgi:hypothetical protein
MFWTTGIRVATRLIKVCGSVENTPALGEREAEIFIIEVFIFD